ncbi:MAG: hypothetical protein HS122_11630 [Opitutaceae bacterium]|nr:hypothetical protein [Opitutaceae bacterium]
MDIRPLRAGPLALVFDADTGEVCNVHAGRFEILRGINVRVRDRYWTTVPALISDLSIEQRDKVFEVRFSARCLAGDIDFGWQGRIRGADGSLAYEFEGEARSRFERNRIGFCVLHSARVAGEACELEHVGGGRRNAFFPRDISPHQPFLNLRSISHEFAPGQRVEARMEGDDFEMEDQRNWTDASFKTYCTPLALPRPVLVAKGTCIRQRIEVRLTGAITNAPRGFIFPWMPPPVVEIHVDQSSGHRTPSLGIIWNAGVPTKFISEVLRPMRLDHLRVDLKLNQASFRDRLSEAVSASETTETQLELALVVDADAESQVSECLAHLRTLTPQPVIARWLIFHESSDCTPPELVEMLRKHVAVTSFAAPVGGGSRENFAELNREPGIGLAADFIAYGLNPQVHAFDADSLIETLAVQGATVENARRVSGGRPVVVSPVTLTPRCRPDATRRAPFPHPGETSFREDSRHGTLFGAAWTLGSLASLAAQGAASATYYETVGPNGVVDSEGRLLPVGEVFRKISISAGGVVMRTQSSHPNHAAAYAVEKDGVCRLTIANLKRVPQRVRIIAVNDIHALDLAPHEVRTLEVAPFVQRHG